MPRQFISAKRSARATPPKAYIPSTKSSKPTLSQQFTASKQQSASDQESSPSSSRNKFKFVPRIGETNQQKIFRRQQEALETGKPHFRVGTKEIYFPQAKLALLRPSAKHTPFQAKFKVPRNFNKLDLRDYLWNVYGLRALNVTTQLLWGRWTREQPGRPRYRLPQIKKMTIEMDQPFIWPAPTPKKQIKTEYRVGMQDELRKYAEDVDRMGSDKFRPPRAFGGIVGPYVAPPEPFVPKRVSRQMANKKKAAEKKASYQQDLDLVKNYLNM